MTTITVTSGPVGGVGKTTITLAIMLNTEKTAIIDLSPDNRSISLLLGLNPKTDILDSIKGGKYTLHIQGNNIIIPIRHREYLELKELWNITPDEVQRALKALEKNLELKYGIKHIIIDTMSTIDLGLIKGAIQTADKLLIPITKERADIIRKSLKDVGNKHLIYVLNKAHEKDTEKNVDAIIPYITTEEPQNQLAVAQKMNKYIKNLIKIALETTD